MRRPSPRAILVLAVVALALIFVAENPSLWPYRYSAPAEWQKGVHDAEQAIARQGAEILSSDLDREFQIRYFDAETRLPRRCRRQHCGTGDPSPFLAYTAAYNETVRAALAEGVLAPQLERMEAQRDHYATFLERFANEDHEVVRHAEGPFRTPRGEFVLKPAQYGEWEFHPETRHYGLRRIPWKGDFRVIVEDDGLTLLVAPADLDDLRLDQFPAGFPIVYDLPTARWVPPRRIEALDLDDIWYR